MVKKHRLQHCRAGIRHPQGDHIGDVSRERHRYKTKKPEHKNKRQTRRRDKNAKCPSGVKRARLTLERAIAESKRKVVKPRPYYI